ncbi:MAG: hypothetical protein AAFR64_12985 [Pseudomonadota bacterium]
MQSRRIFSRVLGLVAIATLAQAPALGRERTPVIFEEGAPYLHPHTGISVPAVLGGIDKRKGTNFSTDALNVGLSYDAPGSTEAVSVYIYRVTSGSLPVWFAQARSSIAARPAYNSPKLAYTVEAITPPGQGAGTGLQAIYDTPDSQYFISTGVAMFAIDGWYVKIRASSSTRDAEALRAWMNEVVASLTLPQGNAPAVAPIEDCASRLKFKGTSKDVEASAASGMLGGLISGIVMDKAAKEREAAESGDTNSEGKAATPVIFCRDHEIEPGRAIYRANESEDSFLFALTDSGVGVSVGRDRLGQFLSDQEDSEPQYSVTLHLEDINVSYTPQNQLPNPERVLEILDENRVTGTVSTWGDRTRMTIGAGEP